MKNLPKAILLVCDNRKNINYYVDETKKLIKTLGFEVEETFIQKLEKFNTKTYLNSGKIDEVKRYIDENDIKFIFINDEINPRVERNISESLEVKVIDRTNIILNIFQKNARTKEAKIQVKIAILEYNISKMIGSYSNLSKQKGGSGMSVKGSGEKQIEIDRRIIKNQIYLLKKELEEIQKNRVNQRKSRMNNNEIIISVVGYTNAGKSTFMNSFVGDDKKVYEEDKLFATLDTTVRKVSLGDKNSYLLVDTVGFVSNLPHNLVKGFNSTLEEIKYSNLIIHLIDYSDPNYLLHKKVVNSTLEQLDLENIKVLEVYNKVDILNSNKLNHHLEDVVEIKYDNVSELAKIDTHKETSDDSSEKLCISAKNKQNYNLLFEKIKSNLYDDFKEYNLLIPFTNMREYNELKSNYVINEEIKNDKGITLKVLIDYDNLYKYEKFIIKIK